MESVPGAVATGWASDDDQLTILTRSLPLPVLTSAVDPHPLPFSQRENGEIHYCPNRCRYSNEVMKALIISASI
jgi:hypothetical protein